MSGRAARCSPLLVATAALAVLLGGCQGGPDPSAGPSVSPTQQGGGSAPGDLLPSGAPSPTDPSSISPSPTNRSPTDATATDATPTEETRPSLGAPGIPECDVLDLPATALPVVDDIEAGGPYDYPRNDGVRFQNREGILPDEDRDYYREFTVETPGLDHRGARRIVTGGSQEADPDHWYFTGDHYESFCEFDPALVPQS